jgi:hypothetical protein
MSEKGKKETHIKSLSEYNMVKKKKKSTRYLALHSLSHNNMWYNKNMTDMYFIVQGLRN